MVSRTATRIFIIAFGTLIIMTLTSAIAAANTVADSGADDTSRAITPNDLKPPECASISVTNLVVGSGTLNGSNANDLILGSSGADSANAKQGDDCVVTGDGDDTLKGGNDDDILLGGGGDDDLRGENGANDICDGGPGTDSSDGKCETEFSIP
jgi:Ca2+-binding RTX toxin-like protein